MWVLTTSKIHYVLTTFYVGNLYVEVNKCNTDLEADILRYKSYILLLHLFKS